MIVRRLNFLVFALLATLPARAWAGDSGLVAVRLGNATPWLGRAAPASGVAGSSARLLGVPGSSLTAALPGWLRWALEPQVQVVNSSASASMTGQGYRGLTWSVPLASGLLHQDDALTFGFSLGQSIGALSIDGDVHDRRSATPAPLLRLGAGLGYQVTPRLGLYVLFDHQSSNGPARVDETQNDLGIRVGLRF